jgi:hypothetical protein
MVATPRGTDNAWRLHCVETAPSPELTGSGGKGEHRFMRSMYNKPGNYVIRVAGGLDTEWSDRLGGLTILELETAGDDGVPIVELTGWLADQAALYGVLNTLYDNRYPLLYVKYLAPADSTELDYSGE